MKLDYEAKFWNSVRKTRSCWHWTSAIYRGYGRFSCMGRSMLAHRFSYELHLGKIPEGLVVDHLCLNKACVKPEHLEAVTQRINIIRAVRPKLDECKRGHPLVFGNVYITPDNHNECRNCKNARNRKSYRKTYKPVGLRPAVR